MHTPVLLQDCIQGLNIHPEKVYVDATLGYGGHFLNLFETWHQLATVSPPEAQYPIFALDRDADILMRTRSRLQQALPVEAFNRCVLHHANYSQIGSVLASQAALAHLPQPITGGVLADLGVSSYQLDCAERGFSFSKPASLDMRMDQSQGTTAADLVNGLSQEALQQIFSSYGEERLSGKLAEAIVTQRKSAPITTTIQLATLVESQYLKILGPGYFRQKKGSHVATQVFQALRIAVNQEFEHLQVFLNQLPGLMAPGARLCVISFHSLEDRIIKQTAQRWIKGCVCPGWFPQCTCHQTPQYKKITKKPVTASPVELTHNPRSRSAKLRIFEKI